MKKLSFILAIILLIISNIVNAQEVKTSKISIGFGANALSVGKDEGLNLEGTLGYSLNSDATLNLSISNASMRSKNLDLNYGLSKYALQLNYDFAKIKTSKYESIFGFSYLNFDKKLALDESNGFGLDLGIQASFYTNSRLYYGFRIVTTYSSFSPGAILNSGIFLKYKL